MRRAPLVLILCAAVASAEESVALTLEEAVRQALAGNVRAGIAEARRERAYADARVDLAGALPALDASAVYQRQRGGDEDSLVGARAVVPLVDAGRWATARASGKAAAAVDAGSVEERRLLAFDAAQAYLAVLAAESVRLAAAERLKVAEEATTVAAARRTAGIIDATAAARLELERAIARVGLTRAAQDALGAREQLERFVIGSRADRLVEPGVLLALPPGAEAEALAAAAEAERPDLRALRLQSEARHLAARAPAWDWAPRLSAFAERSRSGGGAAGFAGGADSEEDWAVGLEASWRLFDSGERGARRRSLLAQAREADLLDRSARTDLVSDVRLTLAALAAAQDGLAQAEIQARIASDLHRAVSDRFVQGLGTALDQADAAAEDFAAAAELARARVAVRSVELVIARVLGRWPSEAR
jgi:outer membrane protein TolC